MTFEPGQLVEYRDYDGPLFLAVIVPAMRRSGIHYIRLVALRNVDIGIFKFGWCSSEEQLRIIE